MTTAETANVQLDDDAHLAVAAAGGDSVAFGAIYDRYADRLYDFCVGMLRDREAAADCVQDVFVTAATKLALLREPDRLRSWLYAIARHEAIGRLNARRREDLTDTMPDQPSGEPDTEALAAPPRPGRPDRAGLRGPDRPGPHRAGADLPPRPGRPGTGRRTRRQPHQRQHLGRAAAGEHPAFPRCASGGTPHRRRSADLPDAGRDPARLGRETHRPDAQTHCPPHRRLHGVRERSTGTRQPGGAAGRRAAVHPRAAMAAPTGGQACARSDSRWRPWHPRTVSPAARAATDLAKATNHVGHLSISTPRIWKTRTTTHPWRCCTAVASRSAGPGA